MIKSNKQIGAEIKKMRETLGLSQMRLAEEVGVSFQQIQKYEKGINRISVERIQQISKALGTSVDAFFEKEKVLSVSEPQERYYSNEAFKREKLMTLNQEEVTLLLLFRKIENKKIRKGLIEQLTGIVEVKGKKK
jgi:transcriptional regulator with XRE-family HTH domain